MALRSGYKGFKKLLGLKTIRPGTLAVDDAALANTFFPRSEQAVLGAYNILTSDYRDTFPSTKNGVDMTENADGTLVLDGTSTAAGEVTLKGRVPSGIHMYIPKGHWVYSVGSNLVKVYVGTTYNGSYSSISAQADGTVEFDITDNTNSDYKLTDGSVLCSIYFSFANGATFNNVKLYPMISPNGDVWVPPVMTNKELTEQLNAIFAESLTDGTTFNIPYKRKSDSRNTSGLIVMSGGLYHYFIHPSEQSNTVDVTKILDVNASRSATATFADDVLTVTFNATVPGGITLLTGNRA